MIKIARAKQRRRFKSEAGTILPCLSPLLGDPNSLEPLLEVNKRTITAEAEHVRELSTREELLLTFLSNDVQIFSESVAGVCANPDSLVYSALSKDDESLTYRNPSAKTLSFVEVVLGAEREVTGSIVEKMPVDYARSRSLFSLAGRPHSEQEVLALNADCTIYVSYLRKSESLIFETVVRRQSYCLVLEGAVQVGNERLIQDDAALFSGINSLEFASQERTTLLIIDLPNQGFVESEEGEAQE